MSFRMDCRCRLVTIRPAAIRPLLPVSQLYHHVVEMLPCDPTVEEQLQMEASRAMRRGCWLARGRSVVRPPRVAGLNPNTGRVIATRTLGWSWLLYYYIICFNSLRPSWQVRDVMRTFISSLLHSCPGLATYWRMCKCCVTYLLTHAALGRQLFHGTDGLTPVTPRPQLIKPVPEVCLRKFCRRAVHALRATLTPLACDPQFADTACCCSCCCLHMHISYMRAYTSRHSIVPPIIHIFYMVQDIQLVICPHMHRDNQGNARWNWGRGTNQLYRTVICSCSTVDLTI